MHLIQTDALVAIAQLGIAALVKQDVPLAVATAPLRVPDMT